MLAAPVLPPEPTPGVAPPPVGAVPESTFFSPYVTDTTLPIAPTGFGYAETEENLPFVPIGKKKGK